MSGGYSIKDLERLTGIKAHTLRIWEKRYNIVKPERSDTNIRCYNDENLKRLLNISILVKNGYKISKIADLDDEQINEKVLETSRLSHNYASQIESLIVSMIELDEVKFETVLNSVIIRLGFERTVFDILYPLFERIGILWQIGSINPAQEHFISNLIRRKMFVAIDGLPPASSPDSKQFILFLPEWELHEIGLLLYDYLIRKKGHKVIYLGQSLPMDDLLSVSKIKTPDYILTSFTAAIPKNELRSYVDNIANNFQDQTILITGIQASGLTNLPENVFLFPSTAEFKETILE
ncbi:MAG: MerR family transcriptional regulator [Bacteroidota bacterium]|nr:MerR family transcriptional regulator [Bacteroidota bacterium]